MPWGRALLGRSRKEHTDGTVNNQDEDQRRQKIEGCENEKGCHRITSAQPAKTRGQRAATIVKTITSRSSVLLLCMAGLPTRSNSTDV